jgi:hypothetical protein
VDDEAEEESDRHNGEDDLDKYESDFIDDTEPAGYVFICMILVYHGKNSRGLAGSLLNGRTLHLRWMLKCLILTVMAY